jgi:pectinesterase
MNRLTLAALLIALVLPAYAADVHVRVEHSAPPASPGNEDLSVFPTIQNALDHHPFATPNADGTPGRVFIEIAPGVYHERIIVTQNHANITLLGKGKSPEDVVISNSLNAKAAGGTFFTETMEINGTGFEADNLTVENTAGNTGQAVAVANRGDRSLFKHCRLLGHQDTLFADYGRQYYVDSYIEGGVDYIFGNATAVFERDELHSNGPGFVTAQSRTSADQSSGYVILNSRVTSGLEADAAPMDAATPGAKSTASAHNTIGLGRPWRPYARVIYINTELPAELSPAGWNNWGKSANELTAYYAESGSTGPGASPEKRAAWSHQLTAAEAAKFLPTVFLAGPAKGPDHWNAIAEAARLP